MPPEKSKGGRPSVACVSCRGARRACDGKFADCVKYVSLPATASDAAGPSQPASPPPSRPIRSKVSPGGSEHRGAPIALAAEPAYSPVEEMRDRTGRRYDLKRRRTSEEAVVAVGEQLASAGWAADAVIEADGRTRSGQLDFEQADGRLMELLVVASASVSPDAPLSLQLEQVAGSLGQAAAAAEAAGGERRRQRRRQASRCPARRWASARPARPSPKLMEPAAKTRLSLRRDLAGRRPSQPARRRWTPCRRSQGRRTARPARPRPRSTRSWRPRRERRRRPPSSPRPRRSRRTSFSRRATSPRSWRRVAASSRLRLSPLALGHSSPGFARAGGGEFAAAAGATADPVGARLVRQAAAAGVGRRRRHLDPRLPQDAPAQRRDAL